MKILFIDIDGVLNSYDTPSGMYCMNKNKIRMIRGIVEDTGCKIVLSSSWRKDYRALVVAKRNFKYKKIDLYDTTIKSDLESRGHEVQKWLDEHSDIDSYCIIDDVHDFLPNQWKRLVLTDPSIGITEKNCEVACQILLETII